MKGRIVVTGAGGFIGHQLVKYLKQRGSWVRGADIKLPQYEPTVADQFETGGSWPVGELSAGHHRD